MIAIFYKGVIATKRCLQPTSQWMSAMYKWSHNSSAWDLNLADASSREQPWIKGSSFFFYETGCHKIMQQRRADLIFLCLCFALGALAHTRNESNERKGIHILCISPESAKKLAIKQAQRVDLSDVAGRREYLFVFLTAMRLYKYMQVLLRVCILHILFAYLFAWCWRRG